MALAVVTLRTFERDSQGLCSRLQQCEGEALLVLGRNADAVLLQHVVEESGDQARIPGVESFAMVAEGVPEGFEFTFNLLGGPHEALTPLCVLPERDPLPVQGKCLRSAWRAGLEPLAGL